MMLDRLGIRPVINASGPVTRLGGHRLDDEVVAAMAEAAQVHLPIEDLQRWASGAIAEVTGAEAGCVTAGASAGMLLAAAACIAGSDPARMAALPDVPDGRREIVVHRLHRNAYDHALQAAGALLVEVGHGGYPGAGRTYRWQLEAAISSRTVAIAYPVLRGAGGVLSLAEVIAIAHAHSIPVIVDAAAALPPAANLRSLVASGADLIAFSGGKAIGGPQASGILCGRRDLIEAALCQATDLDVPPLLWERGGPERHGGREPASHGIGRSAKVSKEAIVGLMVALRRYATDDEDQRMDVLRGRCELGVSLLAGTKGVEIRSGPTDRPTPLVEVALLGPDAPARAAEVTLELQRGQPSIYVGHGGLDHGVITVVPTTLTDDEMRLVAERLRAVLEG